MNLKYVNLKKEFKFVDSKGVAASHVNFNTERNHKY